MVCMVAIIQTKLYYSFNSAKNSEEKLLQKRVTTTLRDLVVFENQFYDRRKFSLLHFASI